MLQLWQWTIYSVDSVSIFKHVDMEVDKINRINDWNCDGTELILLDAEQHEEQHNYNEMYDGIEEW